MTMHLHTAAPHAQNDDVSHSSRHHHTTPKAKLSVNARLANRHVLLTGSTGFLGKVLLALLLQNVRGLSRITLLVRPGTFGSADERVEHMFRTSPVLRPLLESLGADASAYISDRVGVVEGDVSLANFGLNAMELAQLHDVDLVLHCAGLVDFTPAVDVGASANIDGALHAADIAQACDAALVHVSTCYVAGAREGQIAEQVHPTSPSGAVLDAEAELAWIRSLPADADPDIGADRAEALGWPNTYTYTKALAEHLLVARYPDLPLSIVRPAIVESAWRGPLVGWNEGYNTTGPLAYLLGEGLRHMPARADLPFDVVPVDMVAGAIAAVGAALLGGSAPKVVQCATSAANPLTVGRAFELTLLSHRTHKMKTERDPWRRLVDARSGGRIVETDSAFQPSTIRQVTKLARRAMLAVPDGAAVEIKDQARKWSRSLRRTDMRLGQVVSTLDLFLPFTHDSRWVFEARALSALNVAEEWASFQPDKLDWRHYWMNVHMPGMRLWSFPKIASKNAPSTALEPLAALELRFDRTFAQHTAAE